MTRIAFLFIVLFNTCVLAQNPSPNIHQFNTIPELLNVKNYFYDNGEEVIVFDALPTPGSASKAIAHIQSKTKSPITWVVILQPGVLQFKGASFYQAIGARIIASRKTVEAMQSEYAYRKKLFEDGALYLGNMRTKSYGIGISGDQLPKVDSVFEGSHRLELKNGQAIILKDLSKPGASAHHTVAYIAEEEAVFVSDLIHYKTHSRLDGHPSAPTFQSWIDNLNELNKIFKRDPEITIYASRGELVSLPTGVYEQIRYLKAAYPIILNYYKANRRNWQGINIPEKFYKEFQTEMEQAFPQLGMPELVACALLACWTCPEAEKLK
jgi:glyoxylase-like metal-dependent hydrolase (beta-lactamase superfamily II)